jgi:hypothetical protein
MATKSETFAARRASYDDFVQRSQWIAGGVGVLLGVTALLFGHGEDYLAALTVTCATVAGACAGTARVQFAWEASKLELKRQEDGAQPADRLRNVPWPIQAQRLMVVGLFFVSFAGFFLVALVWSIAGN